ncbi:hypothetical protein GCM10022221_25680 [Actinocorallia aurea]
MFNFGVAFWPTPRLNCFKVDRTGRLAKLASVPVPQMPWNHDFALTTEHLLFVLDPIQPDLRRLLTADGPMIDALDHHPDRATRFLLVPRDGGRPRFVEHDALLHVHITNAYEDGTDTVVDLVSFEDWETLKRDLSDFRTRFVDLPPSRLLRYRITPSGKVIEQELAPCHGEFPQFESGTPRQPPAPSQPRPPDGPPACAGAPCRHRRGGVQPASGRLNRGVTGRGR